MLLEKPDKEFSAKKTFEFSDVHYDLLKWLENVVVENNCKIEKIFFSKIFPYLSCSDLQAPRR